MSHHCTGVCVCVAPAPDPWNLEDRSSELALCPRITHAQELLLEVEADCYWCLCKLVEGIQDHYTYAQPGIQRAVFKIKELCK